MDKTTWKLLGVPVWQKVVETDPSPTQDKLRGNTEVGFTVHASKQQSAYTPRPDAVQGGNQ